MPHALFCILHPAFMVRVPVVHVPRPPLIFHLRPAATPEPIPPAPEPPSPEPPNYRITESPRHRPPPPTFSLSHSPLFPLLSPCFWDASGTLWDARWDA